MGVWVYSWIWFTSLANSVVYFFECGRAAHTHTGHITSITHAMSALTTNLMIRRAQRSAVGRWQMSSQPPPTFHLPPSFSFCFVPIDASGHWPAEFHMSIKNQFWIFSVFVSFAPKRRWSNFQNVIWGPERERQRQRERERERLPD